MIFSTLRVTAIKQILPTPETFPEIEDAFVRAAATANRRANHSNDTANKRLILKLLLALPVNCLKNQLIVWVNQGILTSHVIFFVRILESTDFRPYIR